MYVLLDTRFGYANVIEYCDWPFESVKVMSEALIKNGSVTESSSWVTSLPPGSAEAFLRWITRLNGDIVFVVGDHDEEVLTTLDDIYVCEHYQFEYAGERFYCMHDPDDAPSNADGWMLHGHYHNTGSMTTRS